MDLFDMVRAAPPPQRIREDTPPPEERRSLSPVAASPTRSSSSYSPAKDCLAAFTPTTTDVEAIVDLSSDENKSDGNKSALKRLDRKISREKSLSRAASADSDEQAQLTHQLQCPPKTKAQQKMFADVPPKAGTDNDNDNGVDMTLIKHCIVRIKRLTVAEIDKHTAPQQKGKKRGRTAKLNDKLESPDVSPSKKSRSKVHIKGPWLAPNGGKMRGPLARPPTPPRLSKSAKLVNNKAELIKRYGARFFNCIVKVKRAKLPGALARRVRKSNLSVSFSEAVEILGGNESGRIRSRKTKSLASVPTRLQRVDATGNVLEDIELTTNTVLKSLTKIKRRGTGNSCNGGDKGNTSGHRGKLKRPALRVPVTGLASLSIADEDEEENQEYIVPNEVPECTTSVRRVPTPVPIKRSTTTTITDNEAEAEPDTLTEAASKPEDKFANTQGDKTDEQIAAAAAAAAKLAEVIEKTSTDIRMEPTITQGNDEAAVSNTSDEATDSETLQPNAAKQLSYGEDKTIAMEVTPELSLIKTPPPTIALEASDDEMAVGVGVVEELTSDVLEIRTSLEDLRELHTPPSRRNSPRPEVKSRHRSTSVESDTSFKSASEHTNNNAASKGNNAANNLFESPRVSSSSYTAAAPTLMTPPQALGTYNGSQTPSGSSTTPASSVTAPVYSPVGAMPSLDDEDLGPLGQLVDREFQLSGNGNALSTGNLDDIMTALDS